MVMYHLHYKYYEKEENEENEGVKSLIITSVRGNENTDQSERVLNHSSSSISSSSFHSASSSGKSIEDTGTSEDTESEHNDQDNESITVLYFTRKTLFGFFLLGIINNLIYVIMIAGAKDINSGGVALIFLADIAPSLVIKGTGPYWFHLVTYRVRVILAGLFAVCSLILVASGKSLAVQSIGVCFSAMQSSLGEASILALSSKYATLSTKNSTLVITFWSSGTGFAGVLGFAWVWVLHTKLNLSFSNTLYIALVLPICWWIIYFYLIEYNNYFDKDMRQQLKKKFSLSASSYNDDNESSIIEGESININESPSPSKYYTPSSPNAGEGDIKLLLMNDEHVPKEKSSPSLTKSNDFTFKEKVRIMTSLWAFMIPLVVVYLAEYCLQSGIWPSIGVPEILSDDDRGRFYTFSNWCYQLGVLISRSSGTFIPPSTALLWFLAALQIVMALFFTCIALYHFWLDQSWLLYFLCVFVGLLGGSVYVSGFSQICNKSKPEEKEISMAIASISDTLGICLADILGFFVQGCLSKYNNIPPPPGVSFQC